MLERIDRRLGGAGDAQCKTAVAVGSEIAVRAGGDGELTDIPIERQIAQGAEIARAVAGRIDAHAACAGRQRRCADGRQRHGVYAADNVSEGGIAVEGDLIICRRGASGLIEGAGIGGLAIEAHGRRAGHEKIARNGSTAIERHGFTQHLLNRAVDTPIECRRMAHQGGPGGLRGAE